MQLSRISLAINRVGASGPFAGSALNLDFTSGNNTLDSRITFTRASAATRTNASGVLETVAIDGPRFDYDPVTLQPKGLLIEEQRTNLLTYSEQFDDAAWTKVTASASANAITSPDGTLDADALIEGSGSVTPYVGQSVSVTSGVAYTLTVFAKSIQASQQRYLTLLLPSTHFTTNKRATYDLQSGTFVSTHTPDSASITAVGNGWYRCQVTATATATGSAGFQIRLSNASPDPLAAYTGDGTSGIYIWGAQLETGAFPTSYIPTTTAAATRAADVAVMTGTNFSSWYRQDEGTLFVDGETAGGTSPGFVAVQNAGLTHFTRITRSFSQAATLVNMAGVDQAAIFSGTTFNTGKFVNIATAYKINDFSQVLNGATAVVDSAGSVPTVDTAQIGGGGYANYLNGHIRRIAYYPRRLSNSELQAITA